MSFAALALARPRASTTAAAFAARLVAAPFVRLAGGLLAVLFLASAEGWLPAARAQDAATLRARHDALAEQLAHNAYRRPLYLESQQGTGGLRGDIYAVVAHSYDVMAPALQGAERWCDILILHLNVKYCRASRTGDGLKMVVGRKYDQPLEDAYPIDFDYRVAAAGPDYLQVRLSAGRGPMSTRDYRIVFEAVPLDAKQSFVHLSYSYDYGAAARIAMNAYLATIGRNKVGFTVVGRRGDDQPVYIGGVRGVIERNAMRYYLAIESYLGALELPRALQTERRLYDWHAAIERYPVQLHELDRDEYVEMKRREIRRERFLERRGE